MTLPSRSSLWDSQTGCLGTILFLFFFRRHWKKEQNRPERRRRLSLSLSLSHLARSLSLRSPLPPPLHQTNTHPTHKKKNITQRLLLPGHDQAHPGPGSLHPCRPRRARRRRRRPDRLRKDGRVRAAAAAEAREGPLRSPLAGAHAHEGARLPDRRVFRCLGVGPQAGASLRRRGRARREAAGGEAGAGEAARRRRHPGQARRPRRDALGGRRRLCSRLGAGPRRGRQAPRRRRRIRKAADGDLLAAAAREAVDAVQRDDVFVAGRDAGGGHEGRVRVHGEYFDGG